MGWGSAASTAAAAPTAAAAAASEAVQDVRPGMAPPLLLAASSTPALPLPTADNRDIRHRTFPSSALSSATNSLPWEPFPLPLGEAAGEAPLSNDVDRRLVLWSGGGAVAAAMRAADLPLLSLEAAALGSASSSSGGLWVMLTLRGMPPG